MRQCGTRGGRGSTAALLLLIGLVLAGCGSSHPAGPAKPPATASATPATANGANVTPTDVRIPKIAAESSLVGVAVDLTGNMQVPSVKNAMQAAWYRLGPVPGEAGPAIVLGHVDGDQQPGIFYRLHELNTGDNIFVKRSDGKELKFAVVRKEQVPKDQFPNDAVYGNTDKPELRLITCGGVFDHQAHNYKDNVIIYAQLAA